MGLESDADQELQDAQPPPEASMAVFELRRFMIDKVRHNQPREPLPSLTIGADWPSLGDPRVHVPWAPGARSNLSDWDGSDRTLLGYGAMTGDARLGSRTQGLAGSDCH
ncbi:hypothetical protein V3481_008093 [Fusarium oxysporum f. sp. vasinfectum]|uniref:Uncharacterized protein n=1 Tax=Fusarium oxysporum f. sp. vasinfectum 25433 TaxID=1089449 RepID=X0MG70_FUSOX|nr:hypothetical protein FOTG_02757 [Fusarium oxysporum f. sp. vasinfectum 25433]